MIEIIQSPNESNSNGLKVFLAGGISNCINWQNQICEKLITEQKLTDINKNVIIFNPRCKEIPKEEPQVKWEYEKLKDADIIGFWFSYGSLNPITLFEYGSHIKSNIIIVVGCHTNYERKTNVIIQTKLARPEIEVQHNFENFYNKLVDTILNF